MHPNPSRTKQRATLVALTLLLLLPLAAGAAQAADAYRYWSYWWGGPESAWEFAQTGPAERIVADGDVEGWRYLVSADAVPTDQPSVGADFAAICGDGGPVAGQARVAVVIDYGSASATPDGSTLPTGDNPVAQCVTVPQGSTGEQALQAAASVRSEQGAACGINGYPATGCFDVVAAPSAQEPQQVESATGTPTWIWIAAGVLVLIAVAAVVVARSRRIPA